jgi:hypothetical protein
MDPDPVEGMRRSSGAHRLVLLIVVIVPVAGLVIVAVAVPHALAPGEAVRPTRGVP